MRRRNKFIQVVNTNLYISINHVNILVTWHTESDYLPPTAIFDRYR